MRRLQSLLALVWTGFAFGQPLPETKLLEQNTDFARVMVDGLHRYLDRELAASPKRREAYWEKANRSEERNHLAKILGVVPERVPANLEYISGPGKPSLLAKVQGCEIHAVRWAVLPGMDAEGLLLEPAGKALAQVVAVPDCEQLPEEIAGLIPGDPFALKLALNGCRVLIPMLINRQDELSRNERIGRLTNIPHREFIHRMAYELGRTMPGYEVQKIRAASLTLHQLERSLKTGLIGYGEGGRLALLAGAYDMSFDVVQVSSAFQSREKLHTEPLDRNIWGLLNTFGDAELAQMIAPRRLHIDNNRPAPTWTGPRQPPPAWLRGAAPGTLAPPTEPPTEELQRYKSYLNKLPRGNDSKIQSEQAREKRHVDTDQFLTLLGLKSRAFQIEPPKEQLQLDQRERHQRQFEQLVAYTQKRWRESETARNARFAKSDSSSPQAWHNSTDALRQEFHQELIGKLPASTMPINPRTRKLHETERWTSYEVVLDVYDDVIAYGILCLPKGMKPGEKRAVIVCQHGLEGRPTDIVHPAVESKFYNTFGSKLADLGYIVYAPQNPYIFKNDFRQLQRKANPLKLSLFSFIIEQHRRTLDFLEILPEVDAQRIGFYGLSYGGKTAMRVPAVEKRYKISICSGDFNEWLGKNVSVELPMSYMFTHEYEMYEFNLGHSFNYAEMAFLIAPRPFMVERGHDDGVGTDEMIAYEYAKVRYLYANRLKLADRTELEFQRGGHEIFLKGTLAFIEKHLGKPGK